MLPTALGTSNMGWGAQTMALGTAIMPLTRMPHMQEVYKLLSARQQAHQVRPEHGTFVI